MDPSASDELVAQISDNFQEDLNESISHQVEDDNRIHLNQSDLSESNAEELLINPSKQSGESILETPSAPVDDVSGEDLHGVQPYNIDSFAAESDVNSVSDDLILTVDRSTSLDVVDDGDLLPSNTSHLPPKLIHGEKRINPFNKIESDDNLWQHRTKSMDEIEKFSDSFSNHSSLPSSPEKTLQITKPIINDEVLMKESPSISHHPQFELLAKEFQQQKPVADFSQSVEDIEQAVREVKFHSPDMYRPEDPWVKLVESPGVQRSEEISPTPPVEHENSQSTSMSYVRPLIDVAGPCDAQDLIEGIIFTANYLGSTQLQSERNPGKNARMLQAQEAVSRIKAPEGESQPNVEVDLFISTDKVKILNADTQETMMDHTLRSISYIADIGKLLVIMARRRIMRTEDNDEPQLMRDPKPLRSHRIICHVFSSADAHLMAQAIGQAFSVAYQQFLSANGIEPQTLTRDDYNELLNMQEMYHDDLVHYSKQENVKDVWVEKKKGEAMGIVIVESGWGSIVPTVVLANLQHGSPVERSGKLSIGDQIMTVNGTSLVGLPLTTCQSIMKGLRSQSLAHLHIVSCPPVVTVIIKRPDLKYQLGFSVQEGIICSLMRGGIAERGGVRVGHRIIEINGRSVVATPHDRIVQLLVSSVGEIQMKTMPATMYRLLTGQEQPVYI